MPEIPASLLLDEDELTAIDAKIRQMTGKEKRRRQAEIRAKGLAVLAGLQVPSKTHPMADAVEMFAIYENTTAREAYQLILAFIECNELHPVISP